MKSPDSDAGASTSQFFTEPVIVVLPAVTFPDENIVKKFRFTVLTIHKTIQRIA